ncbi:hypothetical protein SAMN05216298_3472 [Glycomyces sambucus]|uniref:YbaB/EbfC DNA-binding family protein n=1 Tax=Glycomyces sambucus TaxID=380244 RepID=A0A1G9J7E4_9ACTN|nr:hypothetical protein [Glycomyces sambucus]SDL33440.1 hypothetical protein SAMN05216298_3472 [Glycomyces sambucus]
MSETPEHSEPAEEFDLAAFMADFEKRMSSLRGEALPVRHLVDATSVRIVSEGGEVAVTANIAGALVDVEFLPPAASKAPLEQAALVIDTYERAAEAARDRTHDIVAGFVDQSARTRELARRLVEEARERKTDPEQ